MSKRESYEQKTEAILLPILKKNGFDLWDVEYVKEGGTWYLRAYIDKPGGIMVDDCEAVSRELSDILDEKDFIDDAYILIIHCSIFPPLFTLHMQHCLTKTYHIHNIKSTTISVSLRQTHKLRKHNIFPE